MKQTLPIPPNSESIETDVLPRSDRRTAPRVDCHTVVTAVSPTLSAAGEPVHVIKAHSENVSVGGARLISLEPLPSRRLFLRFLLPTFGDRYVEAEVVSEQTRKQSSLNRQLRTQYVYGVRFTGVMTDAQVMDEIIASPAASNARHSPERK